MVYTGTHDNETVVGWFDTICTKDRSLARQYICDYYTPEEEIHQPFVALAMSSVCKYCIIPLQDWLGLDNSCRINTPSTLGGNWRWRAVKEQFSQELQQEIYGSTLRYGRMNWANAK